MQIIKKNWWDFYTEQNHVLLWTGNTTTTSRGLAVMGRGLAKELSDKYPGIKRLASEIISKQPQIRTAVDPYGNRVLIHKPRVVIVAEIMHGSIIGMFPVKYGWWEDASLDIIRQSAIELRDLAQRYSHYTFVCNFPGIGAGRLPYDSVLKVLIEVLEESNNIIFTVKEV